MFDMGSCSSRRLDQFLDWESAVRAGRWYIRAIPGTQYETAASRPIHLSAPSEMLADITDWRSFLKGSSCHLAELRLHTRTGRPLGANRSSIGRVVHPRKREPKRGS